MVKIFHSDRFVPTLPEGHRFPIVKYQLIREQLLYEGSIRPEQLEESEPVAAEHVLAVHEAAYWEAMRYQQLDPRTVRRIGFPQSPQLVERSRRSCQGTLSAALHALEHGIGLNIAGGTHHAFASHGEGFCLLNDLAISARHLLDQQGVRQILIVDLDVHQGNGTARLFADEPRVFTFSMHGADNYPLRKERSDLDIALPTGMGDTTYLDVLRGQLPRLIKQVKPDFVFFQAGVDVLAGDRLGKLALSRIGCKTRDRLVLETCLAYQIPVAVAIGGGYGQRLSDTVEAHANTFRVAMELYG
ncbi:MAG: histone deacetylase [Bacteroidetes bacterium]|nr:MAG: histone deacetylase [Bacteroidota bacterium]